MKTNAGTRRLFPIEPKERIVKHNSKYKSLEPRKRGTPKQAQEKEQLIFFCLYLCLCFILSRLHHKFKDNFACVAGENYNPGQTGGNNIDPPLHP